MASVNPPGYVQAAHALGAGQLLPDAGSIGAPTMVAVGACDVITPPANASELHAALPRAVGLHQIPTPGTRFRKKSRRFLRPSGTNRGEDGPCLKATSPR